MGEHKNMNLKLNWYHEGRIYVLVDKTELENKKIKFFYVDQKFIP